MPPLQKQRKLRSEVALGLAPLAGARFRRNFLYCAVSLWGSHQRSKMRLLSKLLKNLTNFRTWGEAQSSIRIQEGPPTRTVRMISDSAGTAARPGDRCLGNKIKRLAQGDGKLAALPDLEAASDIHVRARSQEVGVEARRLPIVHGVRRAAPDEGAHRQNQNGAPHRRGLGPIGAPSVAHVVCRPWFRTRAS